MSRACDCLDTVTGLACRNLVDENEDHCRAGHPVNPEPRPAPPGETNSPAGAPFDEDDLLATNPPAAEREPRVGVLRRDIHEGEPDAPPWVAKTLSQSVMGAALLTVPTVFAGVTAPLALGVLVLLGIAGPAYTGWAKHRRERRRTRHIKDLEKQASREHNARVGAAEAMRSISAALNEMPYAEGRDRDFQRGQIIGEAVRAIPSGLPQTSVTVAYYRHAGDALRPQVGATYHRSMPPAMPIDSPEGQLVMQLARDSRVGHQRREAGRGDQLIVPVRSGHTLYGALIIQCADGDTFAQGDRDFMAAYANMMGTAMAPMRRARARLVSPG